MKQKSKLTQTRALIALGVSAGLLMGYSAMAYTGTPATRIEKRKKKNSREESSAPAAHNKTLSSSLNNALVRIFPDVVKKCMHVIVKETDGAEVDFFVFDMQGTLIQHKKMKERDHFRIVGLGRGKYIYRVFQGDVEKVSGQFEIR